VRIRQLTMKHGRTAVSISGVVKDVRFSDNRIEARGEAFKIAEECRTHVKMGVNKVSRAAITAAKK
jgi:hypothetical protein